MVLWIFQGNQRLKKHVMGEEAWHVLRDHRKKNCKCYLIDAREYTSYWPMSISGKGTWTVGPQSKNKIIRELWAKRLRNCGLNLQKYILRFCPKKTIIAYIKTILNKET